MRNFPFFRIWIPFFIVFVKFIWVNIKFSSPTSLSTCLSSYSLIVPVLIIIVVSIRKISF
nr:MAG TPA: hypothetical protein [Caudoviricetes sp.]